MNEAGSEGNDEAKTFQETLLSQNPLINNEAIRSKAPQLLLKYFRLAAACSLVFGFFGVVLRSYFFSI